MNLLLDTHAFLWFVWDHAKLSQSARELIENPANTKFVSVASCWEMAIKCSLGKLRLGEPAATFIPRELTTNGFQLLPISLRHATEVETLTFHHRDPFDRLITTQGLLDSLTVVSKDVIFDKYGVVRRW